ncbi:MAG TPA: hypothetical protein VN616_02945 [Puia sp.]|nr:hypothetical protein [Puia sp.]
MRIIWTFLTSLIVVIPIIAGLVRFRRIGKRYQPLFILLVLGLATELISYFFFVRHRRTNAPVYDIYALLEWLLVFWQFRVWGFLRARPVVVSAILFLPCLVWVAENLYPGNMNNFSPYYRIFYSFLIVMFSVNKINFMITHDNRNLLGHPEFLICIGFIIYFIYDIIYEWAYQSSLSRETSITSTIISLFGYINALTNIIFAVAFLKIPAPKKFELW